MIVLNLKRGPVTLPGPGVYAGASFTFRRLTSAQLDAARGRSQAVMKAAQTGFEALAAYGFAEEDASGARINLRNAEQMMGVGFIIGAVEVAIEALESWTGISLEPEGPPAPITRETLSLLLQDDLLCRWLLDEVDRAARILVLEGNASAGSLDGSSATRPSTKAGQTIAGVARPPAKRAPRGAKPPAGSTARKPSTRRRPTKDAPSGASSSAPAPGAPKA